MKNTIEIVPETIQAIVQKKDVTIIYTKFNKIFVCTKDEPSQLKNGNLIYNLKGREC